MRLCRGGLPVILFVALPQIQQKSKRHQPHLILRQMKVGKTVIKKPGKQLRIGDRYPTCAFFESFSLSTLRLVPLYSASVMAVLYPARSRGVVKSSTTSSVSGSLG